VVYTRGFALPASLTLCGCLLHITASVRNSEFSQSVTRTSRFSNSFIMYSLRNYQTSHSPFWEVMDSCCTMYGIFLYWPVQNRLQNLASPVHTTYSFWIFSILATSSSLMRRLMHSRHHCQTWTTTRYCCLGFGHKGYPHKIGKNCLPSCCTLLSTFIVPVYPLLMKD